MASTKDVLTALRTELVTEGIVRKASLAEPAGKPPVFVEPAGGVPAPGEPEGTANDPEIIVGFFAGGDIPPGAGGGYALRSTIDVRYRTAKDKAQRAFDLDAQIAAIVAPAPIGRRYDWQMGAIQVIESQIWRGFSRLGSSEAQGFDFVSSFFFEIYR